MPNPSRPNILFVFADQLRGSSVGYAGQEKFTAGRRTGNGG